MKRWLASLLALTFGAPALADTTPQPGQWEYSIKMEMPGMPFAMPPMSVKQCLTETDAKRGAVYTDQKSDCKVENLKQSGGKVSYDVVCTGEHAVKGHYEFTVTPTSLDGVGTMDVQGQTMRHVMSGKYLGPCGK
ncbi:DUF3617 domain-containing protein [Fontimonas sp. SYSU GA230001]|uniref:DUF3617 domain-containing protein n=1 Tax=Fontimonas sp. SYSU GA230001 TaxID=3142450 RepID=UPI0032B3ECBB